jgi:hypothetical protein
VQVIILLFSMSGANTVVRELSAAVCVPHLVRTAKEDATCPFTNVVAGEGIYVQLADN